MTEFTPKKIANFSSNLTSMQLIISEGDQNGSEHQSHSRESPVADMVMKKFQQCQENAPGSPGAMPGAMPGTMQMQPQQPGVPMQPMQQQQVVPMQPAATTIGYRLAMAKFDPMTGQPITA